MSRVGNLQTVASTRVVLAQDAYVAGSNNGAFTAAPTDNGAGDSTCTLDPDYPPLGGGLTDADIVEAQTEAATNGHCVVERLTATTVRVYSFVLGVATDLAYSLTITKRLQG
jgi:hypothetical protein